MQAPPPDDQHRAGSSCPRRAASAVSSTHCAVCALDNHHERLPTTSGESPGVIAAPPILLPPSDCERALIDHICLTARAALAQQRPRGRQAQQEEGLLLRHSLSPRRRLQSVSCRLRPSYADLLHLQSRRFSQQVTWRPRWPHTVASRCAHARRSARGHEYTAGTEHVRAAAYGWK